MVVVIGNPVGRKGTGGIAAGGLPVAVARAVAEAGGTVQLVGRVGDGPDGDAVVLAVAEAGIGHAALLRGPVPVTIGADGTGFDGPIDDAAVMDDVDAPIAPNETPEPAPGTLDPADLSLGLRYLADYRVVVVAQPLAADALAAVVDAARWAEARLVVVIEPGGEPPAVPDDATLFEAPDEDAAGAFATMVGRYAAALDAGAEPAGAFAAASGGAGWSAVTADPG
jgi:hypothetical protein